MQRQLLKLTLIKGGKYLIYYQGDNIVIEIKSIKNGQMEYEKFTVTMSIEINFIYEDIRPNKECGFYLEEIVLNKDKVEK